MEQNNNTGVTVYMEEEYGYRYWRWDTHMTEAELISFWKGLETVENYFYSAAGLPGYPAEINNDEWEAAHDSGQAVWTGHIHMDNDSYLYKHSVKRYVLHTGFVRSPSFESFNCKEID